MGIIAALLSIAIAATAAYTAVGLVRHYISNQRSIDAANSAATIMHNAALAYAGVPGGWATTAPTAAGLVNAGVIPAEDVVNGNVVSPFDTPVTFSQAQAGTNPGNLISHYFTLSYQVPVAECPLFAADVLPYAARVSVNGTIVQSFADAPVIAPGPNTPLIIGAACKRSAIDTVTLYASVLSQSQGGTDPGASCQPPGSCGGGGGGGGVGGGPILPPIHPIPPILPGPP